ncbi:Uncharacterized protein conserved in bacteria [Neisseria gonorrhoeae]|uniref:Protein-arginine rhamnosyltransferase n=1 Tax=Neisseria gonorrhoeae TaxID=485 RepID=A0A378VVN7_NEIGO|nr:Uncharacterized protein conserved in bacteria [Neisseria gonorrhoeae]
MWQQAGSLMTLLLAGAQIIDSLKQSGVIPQNALQNDGGVFQTASVRLVKIPFVPQQDFDKLLHLADCAVIRGEDSFVRTQLAGKPFFGTSTRKMKTSISTNSTPFGIRHTASTRPKPHRCTASFRTTSTAERLYPQHNASNVGKPCNNIKTAGGKARRIGAVIFSGSLPHPKNSPPLFQSIKNTLE